MARYIIKQTYADKTEQACQKVYNSITAAKKAATYFSNHRSSLLKAVYGDEFKTDYTVIEISEA